MALKASSIFSQVLDYGLQYNKQKQDRKSRIAEAKAAAQINNLKSGGQTNPLPNAKVDRPAQSNPAPTILGGFNFEKMLPIIVLVIGAIVVLSFGRGK